MYVYFLLFLTAFLYSLLSINILGCILEDKWISASCPLWAVIDTISSASSDSNPVAIGLVVSVSGLRYLSIK